MFKNTFSSTIVQEDRTTMLENTREPSELRRKTLFTSFGGTGGVQRGLFLESRIRRGIKKSLLGINKSKLIRDQ